MVTLETSLNKIADDFVAAVLETVRKLPLQELHAAGGAVKRGGALRNVPDHARSASRAAGRLPRRSADEIATVLARVVALVKKGADGLRAEQIRQELGLQAKEMPRILKEGLSRKVLKSRGQKRATTYFAK